MNPVLTVLRYLLTSLTIIALITVIFLFFFQDLVLPNRVPEARVFDSGIDLGRNFITDTGMKEAPGKNITVLELVTYFKKPVLSTPVSYLKDALQEPVSLPVYDKKRLEYLGFAEQEGHKVYLFKDTLYNDVIRIIENVLTEGFNMVSIDEDSFIVSKKEDLFWVIR